MGEAEGGLRGRPSGREEQRAQRRGRGARARRSEADRGGLHEHPSGHPDASHADLLILLHLCFYSSQSTSHFGCNSNFTPDATSHALAVAEGELVSQSDWTFERHMTRPSSIWTQTRPTRGWRAVLRM